MMQSNINGLNQEIEQRHILFPGGSRLEEWIAALRVLASSAT